jgi:hypothetical protein
MNIKPRSTSALLVGFLLIFFLSGLVSAEQRPYDTERLNAFKDISSHVCQPQESPKLGQLKIGEETINFPWALRYIPGISSTRPSSISCMKPAKDDTIMNNSNSTAKVEDLSAINSIKLRDLHYNDSLKIPKNNYSENREPCGNYLGIDVRGITVSAINTMERGSAVATSNIIINPVQIIDLAPEVEEKLK